MALDTYMEKSGKAMLAATLTFDHARAAEKMGDPNCSGEDNSAWKEGPYLSAPANMKQIDRSHPYCFRTSIEFQKAAAITRDLYPEPSANGGVQIPLPPRNAAHSRIEPVISKLAIIEQFELFKEFLQTFGGPYNKKRREQWAGVVHEEILKLLGDLTDRRNELTHDSDHVLSTMEEVVGYFYTLRQIAQVLYKARHR